MTKSKLPTETADNLRTKIIEYKKLTGKKDYTIAREIRESNEGVKFSGNMIKLFLLNKSGWSDKSIDLVREHLQKTMGKFDL
jgi:hypothetical protein